MKLLIKNLFVVIVAATFIAACGSKSLKQASLIPKDASAVFILDQKAMKEKLKSGNFQMDSVINNLITSIDSSKGKKLIKDWENSGINNEEKLVGFMTQSGGLKNQSMGVNFIVSLNDATKFEAFLKAQETFKTNTVAKGKLFTSMKIFDEGLISWTNEIAMFSFYHNNNSMPNFDIMDSTLKMPEPAVKADLMTIVEKYYSLKDADKMSSVKQFNEMLNKKADAYMFSSSASIGNTLSMLPFQVPKLEELLKDNYTAAYVNFENGKIVMNTTSFLNDRLTSLLKQYGNGSVKLSMLENFPAKNVNAAMLMSFKPEMIGGILKELQLETLIDAGLSSQKLNFNLQDIYKCMKGDLAVAIGDFEIKSNPADPNAEANKPSMKILFNAEVGDKISLNKILDQAVKMQFLINTTGVYTVNPAMAAGSPVYLRIDDKNIIVASDESTYTQYAAKTTKASFSKDFTNDLSGKYCAMYVNVNSFLTAFMSATNNDETAKKIMDKALATFDDGVVTCENIKDGKVSGTGYLRMKNEKENSLVSLANFTKYCVEEGVKMSKENKNKVEVTDLNLEHLKQENFKEPLPPTPPAKY